MVDNAPPARRQPFDSAAKLLVATDPAAWVRLAGFPVVGRVRQADSNLDTIRAQADVVLRVGQRSPWFLHAEFQTSRDAGLPERVHRYNVLLYEREKRPIVSVVVLLRPRADGPALTGHVERFDPWRTRYESFDYGVIRTWTLPTETFLGGPLGTLPLAPLPELFAPGTRETARRARVRDVVEQVDRRLRTEVPGRQADDFRVATHFLLGLKYAQADATDLTRGVWNMLTLMDSKTYRAAFEQGEARGRAEGLAEGLAEGRVGEARRFLIRVGEHTLGPVPAAAQAALDRIDAVEQFEHLADRLPHAKSWDELLAP